MTDQEMLNQIEEFVQVQQELISASVDRMRCTSPIFLKDHVSATVRFGNELWHASVHGIGVRFTCRNLVVDAHCGVLEFPAAFDAFRLSEYFRALELSPNSFEEIQARLKEFENMSMLEKCVGLPRHYTLKRSTSV